MVNYSLLGTTETINQVKIIGVIYVNSRNCEIEKEEVISNDYLSKIRAFMLVFELE